MHAFFQWTAWEMEKPIAYGVSISCSPCFLIIAVAVNMVLLIFGLLIASGAVYYLGYYLRKRTSKAENNNCNFKSGML